jgi:putative ATP-dependent endonuclease of OLD family
LKINKIEIHNFRSVLDQEIQLCDYSLLIGPNNAGKTNVIDAIRVFYENNGEKFINDRDFPKCACKDEESWIEVLFQLTEVEAKTLDEKYLQPDNQLLIRKYLRCKDRQPGIYGYIKDILSDTLFYGAKNVQQAKLGNVIYIPAVSKLDDETKFSGPSPLRELVNGILKKVVQSNKAYEDLNLQLEKFSNSIKQEITSDAKSLSGLEEDINEGISGWGIKFKLTSNAIDEGILLKSLINYKIEDGILGVETDAQRQGQGFQRHFIFTLIRLFSKYQSLPVPSTKKGFSPTFTLLLFEEPEAFLHPAQQDVLGANLKSLAQQPDYQVLISTHSPHFVSHNTFDFPSLIRLRRIEAITDIGQISCDDMVKIFQNNQEINDLLQDTTDRAEFDDLQLDMEAIKYFVWLNPERCDMFFANHVIVVEGATERALFGYLFDTGRIAKPDNGLFILDALGKYNIHRFMNILGALHIPHSVLYDSDMDKKHHPKIKKLIENSANAYTVKIKQIPGDIEAFLGIEKCKKPHRKPQHVLFNIHNSRIPEKKIQELAVILQELIQ